VLCGVEVRGRLAACLAIIALVHLVLGAFWEQKFGHRSRAGLHGRVDLVNTYSCMHEGFISSEALTLGAIYVVKVVNDFMCMNIQLQKGGMFCYFLPG
jgi:hypothetical protein